MAFQAGDPLHKLSARWLNRVDSLVRNAEQSKDSFAIDELDSEWSENTIIRVRNESGAAVPQFHALRIIGPVIGPSQNATEFRSGIVARGGVPGSAETSVCILLEPLAPNAIGRAVVSGIVSARITTDGATSRVSGNGSTKLAASNGGIPVVWIGAAEEGTNDRWAWVFLGPAATTVTTTEPRDGAVVINNCDVNDCLSEGSPWADLVESEICTKVPHQYEIGGGLNLLAPTTQCCDGKIWNEIPAPNSGAIIAGPKILTRGQGLNWYSDWFECADLLRTGSNSCGSAVWEWQANCGSVTYTWLPGSGICAIANTTIYWTPGFPNCVAGSWSGGFCGDGCVPENTGPPEDPCETQSRTVPCVLDYTWVADGSCNCGTAPAPTEPGSFYGQTVTVPCTSDGQDGLWVMIQDCDCGTATPPSSPGSYDGQRATTGCEAVLGDGYNGYSQTLTVRWRLQVFSLTDARLQLVDQTGKVYYDYRLPSPRQWCCLCANSLVYASCGPHWDCPPFAAICVRPRRPEACRVANGCDATMIEVSVSGFANQAGLFCSDWPDAMDSRAWADSINGMFVLESAGQDQDCVASYRRQWDGTAPAGFPGVMKMELLIQYVNAGSRLTFPQPLPAPPIYWYGPVVLITLKGRPADPEGYFYNDGFVAQIAYRRGGEHYHVDDAPDGIEAVQCGSEASFALKSETWSAAIPGPDFVYPGTAGCTSAGNHRRGAMAIAPPTITLRAME